MGKSIAMFDLQYTTSFACEVHLFENGNERDAPFTLRVTTDGMSLNVLMPVTCTTQRDAMQGFQAVLDDAKENEIHPMTSLLYLEGLEGISILKSGAVDYYEDCDYFDEMVNTHCETWLKAIAPEHFEEFYELPYGHDQEGTLLTDLPLEQQMAILGAPEKKKFN